MAMVERERFGRLIAWCLACLCLSMAALGVTGCLEKKPVPEESEDIAAESIDDRQFVSSSHIEDSGSSEVLEGEKDDALAEDPDLDDEFVEEPSQNPASAREASLADFSALSQYPELPNGCEITSLAAVLNYYGYQVGKTALSDGYLAKAPVGQANFYREFVGDPRDSDAYGCYSPVIVAAANSFLSSMGSAMAAHDITGASADELYSRIDRGEPVIVWATRYLEAGHYSVTWYVDGQALTWYTPEHCLVLVGYDEANRTVQLADPLEGAVMSYDMDLFEQRYAELKNQAVVIE